MTYQTGITGIGTTDHTFIEFDINGNVDTREAISAIVDAINLPTTSGVNPVVGFRPSLWAEVADAADVPADVHDFQEPIRGPKGYSMPATQHDGWLWIASATRSQVFDAVKHVFAELDGKVSPARETTGWVYESNRDLTGFEDGTENPGALEAPALVAIPQGEPGAGASVLLYQLWEHRTNKWEGLSTEQQEDAMGRTKADSVELDDEEKPESAHVARTVVEVEGEELEVYRRNVAYGDQHNHGTVFVGFTFDQWRMEEMLRRMAGADGGPRDEITRYTDAIAGGWYVCPSIPALLKFLPEDDDED